MVMPAAARRWTVEEVYNLPADGNRYEVVHGELLVTPSPVMRHQLILQRVFVALHDYLKPLGLHEMLFQGPVDFFHGDDVYVVPDLVLATSGELRTNWREMKHLLLCAEVLSPSSRRGDRLVKRQAYQDAGVETYWIVDPDNARVEVWRPGDELAHIETRVLEWRVRADAPQLSIHVQSLFAPLAG